MERKLKNPLNLGFVSSNSASNLPDGFEVEKPEDANRHDIYIYYPPGSQGSQSFLLLFLK